MSENLRTARCSCGDLQLELSGEPSSVYGCACRDCQRATGSAFAYRAMYPQTAIIAQRGAVRRWRRPEGPGDWIEHVSCPTCGTLVWQEGEGIAGRISVSAGCLDDRDLAPPHTLHFASRRHRWLALPAAIRLAG